MESIVNKHEETINMSSISQPQSQLEHKLSQRLDSKFEALTRSNTKLHVIKVIKPCEAIKESMIEKGTDKTLEMTLCRMCTGRFCAQQ